MTVVPTGITGAVMQSGSGPHARSRRFLLWRIWNPDADRLLFVGLNPSTADATTDDPTVRRLAGFAKREVAGGFELVNLISQRATDPRDLVADFEPADAEAHIAAAMRRCSRVVACWGSSWAGLEARVRRLALDRHTAIEEAAARAERTLLCFGTTKGGCPRHPLYLPASTPLEEWPP